MRLRSDRIGVATIVAAAALTVSACGPPEAPPATPASEVAAPTASLQTPSASDPNAGGYIPVPRTGATPEWKQAVDLFRKGNTLQFKDRLDEAIQAYQQSI